MLVFKPDNALIPKSQLDKTAKRLLHELKRLSAVKNYIDPHASLLLPSDEANLHVVQTAVELKRRLHPELIVVVGIGGSNLGTVAVQEAILGKNWNLRDHPRILYADTVDPDAISVIIAEMQDVLRQGKNLILAIVSKSGSTTETIANFEVLLNVLRRHKKNASDYVVAITDKHSKLWELGLKNQFSLLEIPKMVGGRYSVLSPAGLFPLGMLGIDIKALLAGAAWMNDQCLSLNYRKNPAALSAALLYLHSKAGRNIHGTFLFASDLESLGKWYRQLLGESIGKEFDVNGKRVRVGITPEVCVGSTDLHSVGQLELGGPDDKFIDFVTAHFNSQVKVPHYPEYNALVEDLQKKELSQVMKAIVQGVKTAYRKAKRPYTETRLSAKDAHSIGAFLQFKMVETMLLGKLFNVNPFDQPGVESYKAETRRLLKKTSV